MLGAKWRGQSWGSQATLGLRAVSWEAFSAQALRGSVPCRGSGVQLQPGLPSPTVYIILGRIFLLSAVVLSFLTTFILVSFASQLLPRTRKHNLVSAFISFLTGVKQAGRPCPQAGLSLGKGLERSPKAGKWLISIVSGEREFLGPSHLWPSLRQRSLPLPPHPPSPHYKITIPLSEAAQHLVLPPSSTLTILAWGHLSGDLFTIISIPVTVIESGTECNM